MRGDNLIERAGWPLARAVEAVETLARAAGLGLGGASMQRQGAAPLHLHDPAWLERLGERLGLEIEPVSYERDEAESLVRAAAPAVLRLGEERLLVLARVRRGRAWLIAPDGSLHGMALARLARTVAESVAAPAEPYLAQGLERAGLAAEERARVLARLAQASNGHASLAAWILRPAAGAPWREVAATLRLLPRLVGLLLTKIAEQALWVLSWWLVGQGALAGRFEPGWLVAWILALACVVPLQVASFRGAGRLAVDLGAEIRRRLMAGALRMQPDQLREEGVGRSLGRVLESEALESLALGGGFQSFFATIEIAAACVVLAAGASAALELAALLAWLGLTAWLVWRYLGARRSWTDRRLSLTHELVEAMVGHTTRLVQEDREQARAGEDRALEGYLESARRMDRRLLALMAWVPRGWMLIGVLAVAPAFLGGSEANALAVALGGVVLAYRGLRRMIEGLTDLAGARVAWERVEPLLRAAERSGLPADLAQLALESRARASREVPALAARQLGFRRAGRGEAVLAGCDLELRAGEKLVLEGRSGSGKSTLASILGGFRPPDAGLVLAGGLDPRTLGAVGWRERVALAPQFHENHLFGSTLLFNLLMGREWPPSPADVQAAETVCARLGLGPLLERMPGGILQHVGETGWRLSHGERARVWIARALLQRAGAVILDEGLDALDPHNLGLVQAALLDEPAAVLVIAHT